MNNSKYLLVHDPGKKQDPGALQVYRQTFVMMNENKLLNDPQKVVAMDDLVMQYQFTDKRYSFVADFLRDLTLRQGIKENFLLVFDTTGVGEGLKDALFERGVTRVLPIYYLGDQSTQVRYVYRDQQDRRFKSETATASSFAVLDQINVPKPIMVECAKRAMEWQEVRIVPNLPFVKDFERQMEEFTGTMTKKGYRQYNNSSDDVHDEWVNCFMMRSWVRQKWQSKTTAEELELTHGKQETADILGDY